jgi:molybdate-binding protein
MDVELVDDPEALARTVVIAGCAPGLSLWARSAERWFPGLRVQCIHANSMVSLAMLERGEVHMAGMHLRDPATGEHNRTFMLGVFGSTPTVLVNLGEWEEGLIIPLGNPKSLRRVSDLAKEGVRIINREHGSGSRLFLDTLLQDASILGQSIAGYIDEADSHQEVARIVAVGGADAGISVEAIAANYGLGFVPLGKVRYDLAMLEAYLDHEPVRQLLSTLQHRWVRRQLSLLGGFDTTFTGEMTKVC